MCGIAGLVDLSTESVDKILHKMTNALYHRGPDAFGYSLFEAEDNKVGLGHRRLSILDLSPRANQPVHYEHLSIVYNGEVYNYIDIRLELRAIGYTFESESDTEVVLKAIHAWSHDAYKKFNGMYAIAIYDHNLFSLTLIRDRLGVKPLYYFHEQDLFLFASESKALQCHPKFTAMADDCSTRSFFRYGYIPDNQTIYKNTFQVPPGSYLSYKLLSKSYAIKSYWDLSACSSLLDLKTEEDKIITDIEDLLLSACKIRTNCDVSFGAFLSGGYDSSLICALTQKLLGKPLKTFTIAFDDTKYDESFQAREISRYLGTEHHEFRLSKKDALEYILKSADIWDEPLIDESTVPMALLSHHASQHVKVALSADGGDEFFWGYPKYQRALQIYNRINSIPGRLIAAKLLTKLAKYQPVWTLQARANKFLQILATESAAGTCRELQQIFNDIELERLLSGAPGLENKHSLHCNENQMLEIICSDLSSYHTSNILVKVDRATMHSGLEARSPFLDHRVVEYMMTVDPIVNTKINSNKYLIKKLAHKYIPRELLDRPKMGFSMPLMYWLRKELSVHLDHYLNRERLLKLGCYNMPYIEYLITQYQLEKLKDTRKLWAVFIMEMWREKYV
jgi:asparagine synthase (glutamine-hydrolysing)